MTFRNSWDDVTPLLMIGRGYSDLDEGIIQEVSWGCKNTVMNGNNVLGMVLQGNGVSRCIKDAENLCRCHWKCGVTNEMVGGDVMPRFNSLQLCDSMGRPLWILVVWKDSVLWRLAGAIKFPEYIGMPELMLRLSALFTVETKNLFWGTLYLFCLGVKLKRW